MTTLATRPGIDRGKAAAAVALLHLALGWAIIHGLGVELRRGLDEPLRVFAVTPPAPPPPAKSVPEPVPRPDPEGAAAPPSLKARPTPIVAPRRPRPSRVRAAPQLPAPTGSATRSGASSVPGPGTGAGGEGSGSGSGRGGGGTGGGSARRAERIGGSFDYSDHPDRGRSNGVETVGVRFLVATDGRVRDCAVTRSSGNPRVDSTTCRLIEQRFRYRPALDASGRPVASVVSTIFSWIPDERRRRR